MSGALFFPTLMRRSLAIRPKVLFLQKLSHKVLRHVINKLSVYDATALLQQSRGIHALCDVKNRQKYCQLQIGRDSTRSA